MSKSMMRFARAAFAGVAMGVAGVSFGSELNISDEPLFLGYTVDPNVFFMLDDSGSMDWEITTIAHWDACGYDSSYPESSCTPTLRSSGGYHQYRYQQRKLSTSSTWSTVSGTAGTTQLQTVFETADNLYGGTCSDTFASVESCIKTPANVATSTKVQTGSGSSCTAPSGYEFTYVTGSGSTRKCGYYTWYSYQWIIYRKDWRVYSSDFNVTYYNPATKYEPWLSTDMTDATFTAARSHPQSGQDGYSYTRDLGGDMNDLYTSVTSGFVYEVWKDTHGYTGTEPARTNRSTGANGMVDVWDEHYRYVVTSSSVTKYPITYTSSGGVLTEVVGTGVAVIIDDYGRTADEIRQNIANWYQYSRRRMLMAKGTIGEVISKNNDFRFGLSVINMNATTGIGTTGTSSDNSKIFMLMPDSTVTDYATHNTNLLEHLYKFEAPGEGTPLRAGLDNAGRYYSGQTVYNTNTNSLSSTTLTNPITESCQQNFTVLFTDGYWTTDSASTAATSIDDRDEDGYANSGSSQKTTVADVARYYADHDLNTSYPNNVPVIDQNGEATGTETFQHMTTFTAAFGVQGELSDSDGNGLPDTLTDITTLTESVFTPSSSAQWGKNPWSYDSGKIDDLWHAAYNSGGDFISARTPQDLVDGLNEFMEQIQAEIGSSSSVAASSGSFRTDTMLYLAKFTSQYWYGELEAYKLTSDSNGNVTIASTPSWDAGSRLLDQVAADGYTNGREILTYNPSLVNGTRQGKGIAFNFPAVYGTPTTSEMASAQIAKLIPNSISTAVATEIVQNQLKGTNLVNWLRGDTTNEENVSLTGYLRNRVNADGEKYLLGDIVNSSPKYVAVPNRLYPNLMEGSAHPYSEFREAHANRTPMIYAGANDGMLHAFNASEGSTGGKEVFAYVPASIYGRLSALSSPDYSHKYSVDGTVEVSDVFFSGAWHTVLVGGLAGGGQGIYALDITNGPNVDESDAADTVLWEFTDTNYVAAVSNGDTGSNGDSNLGYTYSRPQLVKLANGSWAAVFGNGYNNTTADGSASTTGYAYLYFVDIGTGKLIRRIEVPVGTTTTPNGLATVSTVDVDGDFIADYIYGGDLYGNLWRFNVVSDDPDDWAIAHSNKAVFQTSSTALDKPITVKPSVARHPTGIGVMVLFGTGKFIERNDSDFDDKTTQTFYGIWDTFSDGSLTYPVPASTLLQQEIDEEVSNGYVRVTTDNGISWGTNRGWYFDLEINGNNYGETIATDSLVRGDRIIFISMMPPSSPCEYGGTAWIYELNFATGGRLPYSPIDVNNDGVIDSDDKVNSSAYGTVAGGGFKKDNLLSSPAILADTESSGKEHKVMSTSAGTFENVGESTDGGLGRRSWRQMH